MPFTVNGIGTSLSRASRERNVEGHTQYDAIESFVVFFCPIIPMKAVHVLTTDGTAYRAMPLRMTPRLVLKAFLNNWANTFLFIGGLMGAIFGVIMGTMDRPLSNADWGIAIALAVMFVLGGLFKLLWRAMDANDERVVELIGVHDLGTADPYLWPNDTAKAIAEGLLESEKAASLTDVAEKALAAGQRNKAMFCVRLAQRDGTDDQTRTLYQQIMNG